ncbi:MAG: diacylglycerol kinase family protein [Clostridia bacterium]|nr:diacylglycerol kinase family protein [Clostridia bacterium]
MEKYVVLYNKLSGAAAGTGKVELPEAAQTLKTLLEAKGEVELKDIATAAPYDAFYAGLAQDAKLVLCGGDGTLNRFVNEAGDLVSTRELYFYSAGTGNDFARDIGWDPKDGPVEIGKYLVKLPTVTVNGKTCKFINGVGFGIDGYCCEVGDEQKAKSDKPVNGKTCKFINGVGFGIDGYCCEVGDEQKAKSDKPVNYTSIAINGLLFKFKSKIAEIDVDGQKQTFKNVWIAPTMFGRYYGGGMNAAPAQQRLSDANTVSLVIMHGKSRLGTLMVFPSIFKGEHINHPKKVSVFTGHHIKVRFNEPSPLQIDGETVKNVLEYAVDLE